MSEEPKMELQSRPQGGAMAEVEQQRAIAETQAAMVIAKRFPRDQKVALDRILQACTRPGLAEQALYSYNRGGTEITGPSIRLAEAIAQQWGNIKTSVRELEQRNGESTVQTIAWDLESGYQADKVFQVPHVRYRKPEKGGSVKLTDPRDIYELCANNGARRLRACILAVIPGDVVESAVRQAEFTLKTKIVVTPELIQQLLDKFSDFGVSKEMIEKYIQRHLDAATPALIVRLNKIGNSLRDGMSSVSDWFGGAEAAEGDGNGPKRGKDAFMAATEPPIPPVTGDSSTLDSAGAGGPPTIGDVRTLIDAGKFDEAADLARSFPKAERAALEREISAKAKKATV